MTWALANWKLIAAGLVLAFTHFTAYRLGGSSSRVDLAEFKFDSEHRSEMQRQANRSRTYAAETAHVTQTIYRDRYITQGVKEINREAPALNSFPVPVGTVRVLNDIARCARENRPTSCGADDAVPVARRSK